MVAEDIGGHASGTVAHRRRATLLEAYNFMYMQKYNIIFYKHTHTYINIHVCVFVFSYNYVYNSC